MFVLPDEIRLLKIFAHWVHDVLDVGTGDGIATRALASEAKRVCTVDTTGEWPEGLLWNVRRFERIPDLEFDLAFIAAGYEDQLDRVCEVIKPGGIVIMAKKPEDDFRFMPLGRFGLWMVP